MAKRILVVDDDQGIREMVATTLSQQGYNVECAPDGNAGLSQALSFDPDLIISDIVMPGMDGWSFVRALRANPEMSLVPVVFLSALNSEDDRILGFRLGADDYLAKPFRLEELELRVARVLRNVDRLHQQIQEMSGPGAEDQGVGFKGDLTHLGVSAVLMMLEMERKSGILVLRGEQRTGRVFFREGQVIAASIDETETPKNADAVYELLTWKQGRFEFTSLEVDMADQVNTSTTHLLMEGARRIDEETAGSNASSL